MRTRQNIDRLILDIHAAPLDERRWAYVVEGMRRALGAERGWLFVLPDRGGDTIWETSVEIDPGLGQEYGQEFAREDAWIVGAKNRHRLVAGQPATGEELVDRSEFCRSRFYNELLSRYHLDRFLGVPLRDLRAPSLASISFFRGPEALPFGRTEHATLTRLAPHLIQGLDTFLRAKFLSLQNLRLLGGFTR